MKTLLLHIFILFSFLNSGTSWALTQNIGIYPICYRGALQMANGEEKEAFLTIGSLDRELNIARISEFRIGESYFIYNGTLANDRTIILNDNNDYIPGGNATYNIDIALRFDGRHVTGSYKKFVFEEGYGGFGSSDPSSLLSEGQFELRKCRQEIRDLN